MDNEGFFSLRELGQCAKQGNATKITCNELEKLRGEESRCGKRATCLAYWEDHIRAL